MKLFEETKVGTLMLKNRLWRLATWLRLSDDDGHLTEELIGRYHDLAKGGAPYPKMLCIYSDEFIQEYQEFMKLSAPTELLLSCK